jgi:drug/metabolite transporter (DMT)-like permease
MQAKENHFNIKKAVFFILLASLFFSAMALCVKLSSSRTNINMIIFVRFGISFLYVLMILGIKKIKGKPLLLKTNNILLHVLRSISGLFIMFLLYFSLKYISLVTGNLLIMTNPLFIPILGLIFFHQHVDWKHWVAVFIGFIGISFIIKPGYDVFNPIAILPLIGAIFAALVLLLLRILRTRDSHYACLFYNFLFVFIISVFIALFDWKTPDFYTLCLLLSAGVLGTIYQELLIRATSYAPAKVTSSLLYSSLIFSLIFDWIFWHNVPDLLSLTGIVLVCICNILTVQLIKNKITYD